MPLPSGFRLGSCEILGLLGSGGMGEVYKARDRKLQRDVAIKVLPAAFAADKDRLRRFHQEAQVLAALGHPDVVQVFNAGDHGGQPYLVMELLAGETLRQRLDRGRIPWRKAVELAAAVAEGLAAAHAKGIVHRDLKPENLFLTEHGRVKILDFGLAKLRPTVLEEAETVGLSSPGTLDGALLGTVGYMSPEQVRGQAADARSDVFALGCVLYEMVTGKPAFRRETTVDTLSAILKEPVPEAGPSGSGPPVELDRILFHCLEKAPEDRFQSAQDLAFDLRALGHALTPAAGIAQVRKGPGKAWYAAGILALAAALALGGYRLGNRHGRRTAATATFAPLTYQAQAIFQAAFMPDGKTVVYSAALQGNTPSVFVLRPESPDPRPIGEPGTHLLAVSSRGELALLLRAHYKHHRIFQGTLARGAPGGTPREVLDGVTGAAWSPEGASLAIVHRVGGKDRLEFPIGHVLLEEAGYLSDLRFSPSGEAIALFQHPRDTDDEGSVILVDLKGRLTLLAKGFETLEGLAWAGDEVLFGGAYQGVQWDLWAVGKGRACRKVRSAPGGLVIHDVEGDRLLISLDQLVSRVCLLAPGASGERDLDLRDQCYLSSGGLSGDGARVLVSDQSAPAGNNYAVYLCDTRGGTMVRLGEGLAQGLSPDGAWAIGILQWPASLVELLPTGPGEPRRLPIGTLERVWFACWLGDGRRIALVANEPGKICRGYVQEVTGGPPRAFTPEGVDSICPSPDGRKLLCHELGRGWVLQDAAGGIQPVPGIAQEEQVAGWNPDGFSVYVYDPTQVPFRFEAMALATGRRKRLRVSAPQDPVGVLGSYRGAVAAGGRALAYDYSRLKSQLFILEQGR